MIKLGNLAKTAVLGVAAAGAMAASANAATIIRPFATGPFSDANQLGTAPTLRLLQSNIYDFTFTLTMPLGATDETTIGLAAANAHNQGEPLLFTLFAGTPGGSHHQIDMSANVVNPVIQDLLGVGSYFVQIKAPNIAVNGEVSSGSLAVGPVPEPATWAMMLVGFGVVGYALRRKVAKTALSAA